MRMMTNTVVGSAIGGLVAGVVALGAAAVMKPSTAPVYPPDPNSAYAMTVANTSRFNNGAQLGGQPQCQPYEEVVLRRAFVNGREVADVTCITRMNTVGAAQAYAQPINYTQPVYRDQIVTRPVAQTTVQRQRVSSREVSNESNRSWAKTAMIIGGGAGGGAGIGGLIGGKKGALIGAALGGGAATVYESTKR